MRWRPAVTDETLGMTTPPKPPTVTMRERKRVALIAHDHCKHDLLDWARFNRGTLAAHDLYATGTTGTILAAELGLPVTCFASGPLGGDQQVGAAIVDGRIDFVIFFWDPLQPQPHDVDVKALLRVAVVYNVPIACNRSTADFLLSSPLMDMVYERRQRAHPLPGGPPLVPQA
jgi:methylglyoxal synthase